MWTVFEGGGRILLRMVLTEFKVALDVADTLSNLQKRVFFPQVDILVVVIL